MKKDIVCTVCPRGCLIRIEGEGDTILRAEGHSCDRGLKYASAEFSHPERILTTTVRIAGVVNDLLPVRSNKPVPREKLFDCMEAIRDAQVELPVTCYDVVIPNISGTGVDIVAVKTIACDGQV